MKIIDAHTHIFPDKISENAISTLEQAGNIRAFFRGNLSGLLESMDTAAIDYSLVLNIATIPKQTNTINNFVVNFNHPRVKMLGSVHPANNKQDIKNNLEKLAENGIKGIKMHPEYQHFCIKDYRMDYIYEILDSNNMLLFLHTGRDIGFVGARIVPETLLYLIKKYKSLKVVAAHLGSYKLWHEVYDLLAGENIYLDLSYAIDEIETDMFNKILDKHSKDKLLFGTDAPWKHQKNYLELAKQMIPLNMHNKIFFENANLLFDFE